MIAGRQFAQAFGESFPRWAGHVKVVRELALLVADSLGYVLATVTDIGDTEPGQAVNILPAIGIISSAPLPSTMHGGQSNSAQPTVPDDSKSAYRLNNSLLRGP